MTHDLLRTRILAAIGAGTLVAAPMAYGCGGVAVTSVGGNDDGVSVGEGGSSVGPTGRGGNSSPTSVTTSGNQGGFDPSSTSSGTGDPACATHHLLVTEAVPEGIACDWDERKHTHVWTCFAEHPDGGCQYDDVCVISSQDCGLGFWGEVVCGPIPHEDGACCYLLWGECAVGRPFTVSGQARVAKVVDRDDWRIDATPCLDRLDPVTRAALADAWTQDGQAEHASIASFARFALQLLALGAPAALIDDTQRAIADELDHARASFGLASAYAGRSVGPGALAIGGALDDTEPDDTEPIVLSVVREGAIAETVSAALVQYAADEARDPLVKRLLAKTAREELEHAELAWRFLRWALRSSSPQMRAAVSRTFASAHDHVGFGASSQLAGDPNLMRQHGYVPIAERREVAERVLRDVVAPAARALMIASARRSPGALGAGGRLLNRQA